ncbi:IS3 family transposase [Flavobacterium mesophilum]|uniref:IS3 family transposase n=1 Tax=Flavobacterium mesophilum TaxID=3143495 RepID=UPI0031D1B1C1
MEEKKKKYSLPFKKNALRQSDEKGCVWKVAEELGIPRQTLYRWKQESVKYGANAFCGSGYGNCRSSPDQKKINELKRKAKKSEESLEILRRGTKHISQGRTHVFAFIESNEDLYSIRRMCKLLGVGEMTYRRWKKQILPKKQMRINLLKEAVSSTFFELGQRSGSPSIAHTLQNRGYDISHAKVARYMNQMGLYYKRKKRFKTTTNSRHNNYVFPNILNRKFAVTNPSQVWVSDITYIRVREGFVYLTIILDLYDRKVIGYSLSNGMSAERTTIPAWEMAVTNRKIKNELIFHSDRGIQYANKSFTSALSSYKTVVRSMSRRGNSIDNAVAESFFCTLKRELVYRMPVIAKEEMKIEIVDFIENWYNKNRIHSALNYKTIEQLNKDYNSAKDF